MVTAVACRKEVSGSSPGQRSIGLAARPTQAECVQFAAETLEVPSLPSKEPREEPSSFVPRDESGSIPTAPRAPGGQCQHFRGGIVFAFSLKLKSS